MPEIARGVEAGEFFVSPDHPALAGHFPGNPIVPGVLLLDYVIHIVESGAGGARISAVPVAKFVRPLLPGRACRVTFVHHRKDRIRFECHSEGELIATGELQGEPAPG